MERCSKAIGEGMDKGGVGRGRPMSGGGVPKPALEKGQGRTHPGGVNGMAHGVFRSAYGAATQGGNGGIDVPHGGKLHSILGKQHQLNGFL